MDARARCFGNDLACGGAAEPANDTAWKQKEFIITFWCPPPATDQALAAVAAEHYNLTWVPVEGLDVAAKHKPARHADQRPA